MDKIRNFIRKYKKWLARGLIVLAINQFSPYCLTSFAMTVYRCFDNPIKIEQVDYSERKNLPSEFSALDYLNLSTFITHYEGTGDGDCKAWALATYKIYNKLVKLNNRNDLENKVRLAAGAVENMGKPSGHTWLEIRADNVWEQYEPMAYSKKEDNIDVYKVKNRVFATYPGTNIPLPTMDTINPLKSGAPLLVDIIKRIK